MKPSQLSYDWTPLRVAAPLCGLVMALFLTPPLWAAGDEGGKSADPQTQAAHVHPGMGTAGREANAEAARGFSIPDIRVLDESGEELAFYSNLIKDKVVAINGIFTTCTTVCPPMGVIFSQLEEQVRERFGSEVHLISVSLDPVTDTPERLKAWAGKFNAGPGWTLVTGDKRAIDDLLKALKLFSPDKEDHASLVLIGNDATGTWTRTSGLTPAPKLAELIQTVLEDSSSPMGGEMP